MSKEQLFAFLQQQNSPVLLQFLDAAYEEMTIDQRDVVFGNAIRQAKPLAVDAGSLLAQVKQFERDSLAGDYYAPFDINSKNFMHVPEKTKAWFDRLGDLLTDAALLSQQGDQTHAVACFRVLYELVDTMCSGDEIVFADEYGTWMIPVDEKEIIRAYVASLAATSTPEVYTDAVLPLIRRDSIESFSKNTYSTAIRAADKAQKVHLKAEVQRLGVPTKSRPRT